MSKERELKKFQVNKKSRGKSENRGIGGFPLKDLAKTRENTK